MSLFALQFAGLYGYFGARLIAIRKEMKALLNRLPESELEKIEVSAKAFQSIDINEGEIELNGKMYDIARIEKHDDQYVLFALHDEHEDNLLSLLDEMIKRSGNDKKPVPSQIFQFLSLVFLPVENHFVFGVAESDSGFTTYLNLYSFSESSNSTPPPWC